MKKFLLTIIVFLSIFLLFCCSDQQEKLGFDNSYLFIEIEEANIMDYKEGSIRYSISELKKIKKYYFDKVNHSIKIDSVSDIKINDLLDFEKFPPNIVIDTSNKFIVGYIFKEVSTDSSNERADIQYQGVPANFNIYILPTIGCYGYPEDDSKWINIFGINCNQEGEIKLCYRFGKGEIILYTRENIDCEIYKEFTLKPNEMFCDSLVKRDFSFDLYADKTYKFNETYNFNLFKETFTITNHGFIKKSNVSYY